MSYLGIGLVYAYRYTLGLLFPTSCKYHPSCSQYAIDALRRYGLVRGSILAGWRLLRCNPWSHGGVDKVENQRLFKHGGTQGSPVSPLLHAATRSFRSLAPAGRSPAPPTTEACIPTESRRA